MEPAWEFGIFTVMSVMVIVLGIVITSRFMYIDSRYNNIIRDFETQLSEINDETGSEDREMTFSRRISLHMKITEYKTHRNENRNIGIKIDLFSIGMILLLAFLAVFSVFEDSLLVLSVLLSVLFMMPLAYLVRHIGMVNRIESV